MQTNNKKQLFIINTILYNAFLNLLTEIKQIIRNYVLIWLLINGSQVRALSGRLNRFECECWARGELLTLIFYFSQDCCSNSNSLYCAKWHEVEVHTPTPTVWIFETLLFGHLPKNQYKKPNSHKGILLLYPNSILSATM